MQAVLHKGCATAARLATLLRKPLLERGLTERVLICDFLYITKMPLTYIKRSKPSRQVIYGLGERVCHHLLACIIKV